MNMYEMKKSQESIETEIKNLMPMLRAIADFKDPKEATNPDDKWDLGNQFYSLTDEANFQIGRLQFSFQNFISQACKLIVIERNKRRQP